MSEKYHLQKSKVVKWGNSQGIRISKNILDMLGLSVNDNVTIAVVDNSIVIQKEKNPTLKDRLEAFYHKPIEEIYVTSEESEFL